MMSKYVAFSLLFFDEITYIQKKKKKKTIISSISPIIDISIDRSNDESVLRCRTDTLRITCCRTDGSLPVVQMDHSLSYRWITSCRTDGSLPVVRLGDVSELLLDGVSVDIDEPEGLGGGSGKSAPLGRVPSPGCVPDGVQARGLDLLDRLLDSVKASQKRRVGLRKCDVQQLLVVVFVLNHFEVRGAGSEKHHFGRFLFLFSSEKENRRPWASRDFGSARKTLP